MISSQELRIGNYVMADEKMQQIVLIDQASSTAATSLPGTTSATTYSLANIYPVVMTDEILRQCGFLYHDYFKFWQLLETGDGLRSEMDIDRDYAVIDFMRKPILKNLTALHQLQNIHYLLKGKEVNFVANKKLASLPVAV